MPEPESNQQVIVTIGKRMTEAFTQTVGEEMARASTKGVPTETFLKKP